MTVRTYTLEYQAALFTAGWGLWLLIGGEQTIDALAFEQLRSSWGAVFPSVPVHVSVGGFSLITAICYAAAIKINGAGLVWTPFVRMVACALNAAFFASIAASIAQIDQWSTGVFTYLVISLYFSWLFFRNVPRAEQSISIMWERRWWKT